MLQCPRFLLAAVVICSKHLLNYLSYELNWLLFFLHGIDKQNLVKIMLGFLDLVIWQTFSQGPIKLAYGFKKMTYQELLPVIKLKFLVKLKILVNMYTSLGT